MIKDNKIYETANPTLDQVVANKIEGVGTSGAKNNLGEEVSSTEPVVHGDDNNKQENLVETTAPDAQSDEQQGELQVTDSNAGYSESKLEHLNDNERAALKELAHESGIKKVVTNPGAHAAVAAEPNESSVECTKETQNAGNSKGDEEAEDTDQSSSDEEIEISEEEEGNIDSGGVNKSSERVEDSVSDTAWCQTPKQTLEGKSAIGIQRIRSSG